MVRSKCKEKRVCGGRPGVGPTTQLEVILYGSVTQKLIRVKIDPAGSLLVAIIDPAGSLLAAKSDPPLQKVIRVQILVDSSLF